jgi:peptidyl-prolyl cis-trans isomerase C
MTSARILSRLTVVLLAVLIAAGCKNAAKKPESAAPKQGETILAEFDGGKITAEELNLFLNGLPPYQRAQFLDPNIKNDFVNRVIDAVVLSNEARKIGLDKDPDVKAFIDLNVNSILAEKYFTKEIQPKAEQAQVTDEELKQYYDSHQAEFSNGQVKVKHILVGDEKEAGDIYNTLKANPSKFSEIAKQKSLDPSSKDKGGELGWFGRGKMVPEFENVAFSTPKGQIASPVKTRFGWHIIMVEDKTEVDATPFEQAKESIRTKLSSKKKQDMLESQVKDLKTKVKLKIHSENFAKVGENVTPAPGTTNMPPMPSTPPSGGR